MQFGLAPVQSRPTFDAMCEQARVAEDLGYETLWAHEHHSQGMMYPDPLMALAVMASVTDEIGLGTNMLLLPIHHPVRVAQEAAMLDVVSDGRLRLGVANGYSPRDLATFGVDRKQRGRRLAAGVELIRELWSGNVVTRDGPDFSLDAFELFPLPLQRPGPPIFIGGQADNAIRRAARLGDNYLISTTESFDDVQARAAKYGAALEEFGRTPRRPLLNRIVCAVPDRAARTDALAFFSRALLALYDAWGHANITRLSDENRSGETLAEDHLIVGEPGECIDRIAAYEEIGIGHIACLMNFGGPEPAMADRSIRLFGERVIPHFA